MIVLVTLVAVLMAMMAVVVLVAVIVVVMVVMPAAAALAMRVMMRVGVGVGVLLVPMLVMLVLVIVSMRMVVVAVPMVMSMVSVAVMMVVAAAAGVAMGVIAVVMAGMVMVIGAALGLERALDRRHRATLATDQLGEDMILLDIDRIGGDFRRRVAVADMPGEAHQPQRVLGADLEQALRRGLDLHEAAILQLHGVAIGEHGRLVEIEQNVEPAITLERDAAAVAVLMVERQRLDDLVGADGRLADDGGGAQHGEASISVGRCDGSRATSTTAGAATQALSDRQPDLGERALDGFHGF